MADMQEHRLEEARSEAERTADELEHRSDQLDGSIRHARETWDEAQRSEGVPSASGDSEDGEPDDATGDDPGGFDDPESVDLDEEEDEDED
jgi:hypothetical protein